MKLKQPPIRIMIMFFSITTLSSVFSQDTDLIDDTSTLFSGSGNCAQCHVSNETVLRDSQGQDLTLATAWRSTIMANAARDPYWQAKVEVEASLYPALKDVVEDKCTTCHAPMARTQAVFDGAAGFSLAETNGNPLGLDGVSCTLCHQIQPGNLGQDESFSGGYIINDSREIYGPYDDMNSEAMVLMSEYDAVFGAHMNSAMLCATCHTLFTPYVDDDGNVAGTFPEQVPFFEWINSIYSQEETPCQSCHMPIIDEEIVISQLPENLDGHSPFWQHHFVGGNALILSILKQNGVEIGVTAESSHFDSTIARTRNQLQNKAVKLTTDASWSGDDLLVDVAVENLAGHKFPTGFPSRRAWLHIVVKDGGGDIVFESGGYDENGRITGIPQGLQPHYNQITAESQVQIYESQLADVNGELTQTLLRASSYLKDNRIPPKGFTTIAPRYQDMAIIGGAMADPNFNLAHGVEGTGVDSVRFIIKTNNESGPFQVTVEMLYQSIKPEFLDDLFQYDLSGVNQFESYVNAADQNPELMQSVSKQIDRPTNIGLVPNQSPSNLSLFPCYPNPFNSSTIIQYTLPRDYNMVELVIYDIDGNRVKTLEKGPMRPGKYTKQWNGTDDFGENVSSGLYISMLSTNSHLQTQKLLLIK